MSEKIYNGGPAFPTGSWEYDGQNNVLPYQEEGMTLRDYFAAKAMPSVYSGYCESARKLGFDEDWELGVAIDAYRMADAMLKARDM